MINVTKNVMWLVDLMIITNVVYIIVILTFPVHLEIDHLLKIQTFTLTALTRRQKLLYLPNSTTNHLLTLSPYPSAAVYTINQDTLPMSIAVLSVIRQSECMIWVVVGRMKCLTVRLGFTVIRI